MIYKEENGVKAIFDDIYIQPTPHDYVAKMNSLEYKIGEHASPYCLVAIDLLRNRNANSQPVQMLDLGCSYGMGTASVKYSLTCNDIDVFLSTHAPRDYSKCCKAMQEWLDTIHSSIDLCCVGVDSSAPAINFAKNSGLLEGGVARDFESPNIYPTEKEIELFRSCNFLLSTGAIGYVTERTLSKILPHFGKDHSDDFGPCAMVTILRMFDVASITRAFEQSGLHLAPVPGIQLVQRNFEDKTEQTEIVSILNDKGISTEGLEDKGLLVADLFLAAPPKQLPEFIEKLQSVPGSARRDNPGL